MNIVRVDVLLSRVLAVLELRCRLLLLGLWPLLLSLLLLLLLLLYHRRHREIRWRRWRLELVRILRLHLRLRLRLLVLLLKCLRVILGDGGNRPALLRQLLLLLLLLLGCRNVLRNLLRRYALRWRGLLRRLR